VLAYFDFKGVCFFGHGNAQSVDDDHIFLKTPTLLKSIILPSFVVKNSLLNFNHETTINLHRNEIKSGAELISACHDLIAAAANFVRHTEMEIKN
jgi:hypothetical protein